MLEAIKESIGQSAAPVSRGIPEKLPKNFSFQIQQIANGFLAIDSSDYSNGFKNSFYCQTEEDAKAYLQNKLSERLK